MNEAFPDILYNGVLLCTGIYLILLALVNFFSKSNQHILLGVLCLLLGVTIVNNLFWPAIKDSLFLSILIGAGKTIFIGPIIFLYLLTFHRNGNKMPKLLIQHLSAPLVLHLVYCTVKFGFEAYYQLHYTTIVRLLQVVESFFLVFYFFKAAKVLHFLKKDNGSSLRMKRTVVLFSVLVAYFVIGKLYTSGAVFIESSFWANHFLDINRYLFMPMAIFVNGLLIFYTVTEMKWIKPLLFRRKYGGSHRKSMNDERLDSLFEKYFFRDKVFTRHEMSMKYVSEIFDMPPQNIRNYLRSRFDTGFKDYINKLRVEELKKLMAKEESKIYTLTGMAEQVGFKSPATFYRIFKKYTGMTPQEYKQKNTNDENITPNSSL